jgi:hypothetical protein
MSAVHVGAAIDAPDAGALLDGLARGIVLVDVEARAGFANAEASTAARRHGGVADRGRRAADRRGPAGARWREALRTAELTVRSQLKSLLVKTGHGGIRELVADVLRAPPH